METYWCSLVNKKGESPDRNISSEEFRHMVVTNRILLHPDYRVLAFCGGRGRSALIRKIADELARHNKKVLISSTDSQKLPLSGDVVIGRKLPILLNILSKEFKERPVIYAAKMLNRHKMWGFNLKELQMIKSNLPADYFLIELGSFGEKLLHNGNVIRTWSKSHIWNQLVFCLELSRVEEHIKKQPERYSAGFTKENAEAAFFPQNLLVNYLTDKHKGVRSIFEQTWPALLFFHGINMTPRENRAITLSRELLSRGIEHIALGNLQSNMIKKINFQ
jgi:hypothetical protein